MHLCSTLCEIHVITTRTQKDYNINPQITIFKLILGIFDILGVEMKLERMENLNKIT